MVRVKPPADRPVFWLGDLTFCVARCVGNCLCQFTGGMLAAWGRMKFPHIFDGVIAGSAPIWTYFGEVR